MTWIDELKKALPKADSEAVRQITCDLCPGHLFGGDAPYYRGGTIVPNRKECEECWNNDCEECHSDMNE